MLTLLFAHAAFFGDGRTISGKINSGQSWFYLTRFVFQPSSERANSSFTYHFRFHRKVKLTLLSYVDSDECVGTTPQECRSWKEIYEDNSLSCQFKDHTARSKSNAFDLWKKSNVKFLKSMDDSSVSLPSNQTHSRRTVDQYVYREISGRMKFRSARMRWIYFVVSNCIPGCSAGLSSSRFCEGPLSDIEYKLVMKNNEGNGFEDEFSADEFGILMLSSVFAFLHYLLFMAVTYVAFKLQKKDQLHHTVSVYWASTCFGMVGGFVKYQYWVAASRGGDPAKDADLLQNRSISGLLDVFTNSTFMLTLIFFAKGWTVVRRKISAMGRSKIAVYASTYFYLSLLTHIHDNGWSRSAQSGLVIHKYETVGGRLFVWTRVVSSIWFTYANYTTIRKYPSKRQFYGVFYACFLPWILFVPFVSVLADNTFELWRRELYVTSCEFVFNFLAPFMMLALIWPSKFNARFPFHLKQYSQGNLANRVPEKFRGARWSIEETFNHAKKLSVSIRVGLHEMSQESEDLALLMGGSSGEDDVVGDEELEVALNWDPTGPHPFEQDHTLTFDTRARRVT